MNMGGGGEERWEPVHRDGQICPLSLSLFLFLSILSSLLYVVFDV